MLKVVICACGTYEGYRSVLVVVGGEWGIGNRMSIRWGVNPKWLGIAAAGIQRCANHKWIKHCPNIIYILIIILKFNNCNHGITTKC